MEDEEKKKVQFGDNGFGGIDGYMDLRRDKLRRQYLKKQQVEVDVFKQKTFWINGRTEPGGVLIKFLYYH